MKKMRQNDKQKVSNAIYLHKKEEAKQAKFVDQQNKARLQNQLEQDKKEKELKNRIQK